MYCSFMKYAANIFLRWILKRASFLALEIYELLTTTYCTTLTNINPSEDYFDSTSELVPERAPFPLYPSAIRNFLLMHEVAQQHN